MSARKPIAQLRTHTVTNQPPPLENYNPYNRDKALSEGLAREASKSIQQRAEKLGASVGSETIIRLGELANKHPPELRNFDAYGHRIDEVIYHPAYHELMSLAFDQQIHTLPWTGRSGHGHVAHAALIFLLTQVESGVCCPVAMAYAAVPSLNHNADIAKLWLPRLFSREYDARSIPASEKSGCTIGMAMTEKQGGSDVRTNKTRAVALQSNTQNGEFHLTGHKWFCSAPMSDVFLTLAQTDNGISCFLVPRWLPDETRNPFYIQRLKDKLGNRSNASAEIEFDNTWGQLVGEEGDGVRNIIDMVHHTRLDAAASGAGLMRAATAQAIHHAAYRSAFSKRLIEQPCMANVLADLALESEAATVLFLRVARSFDEAKKDKSAQLFGRLSTAIAKYWINKRAPYHIYEALECHGGAGFVEESIMPRLYREAPLNSIWEGSGNVICLDILHTLQQYPDTTEVFLDEIQRAQGLDRRLDLSIQSVRQRLTSRSFEEPQARRLVEDMAVCLQGCLLVQHAPDYVAEAFCASRVCRDWGYAFGTLGSGLALNDIIERAKP